MCKPDPDVLRFYDGVAIVCYAVIVVTAWIVIRAVCSG